MLCVCVSRRQPSGLFFRDCPPFCCCCFEPASLPSLKFTKYTKMAGWQASGTCLSPSSQGWGLQSHQPSEWLSETLVQVFKTYTWCKQSDAETCSLAPACKRHANSWSVPCLLEVLPFPLFCQRESMAVICLSPSLLVFSWQSLEFFVCLF